MKNFSVNTKSLLIMGIINATPDSFPGDGIFSKKNYSLEKECEIMIQKGVNIIDVGGESTRPKKVYKNVKFISEDEELNRVIPIIEKIKNSFEVTISIDSKKHKVIEESIKAGAKIVNDISMLEDRKIIKPILNHDVYYVLNHFRQNTKHINIVPEVLSDLSEKIELLVTSGFKRENIILDPGIGFGKSFQHSKDILANLEIIKNSFNLTIMIGTSRKSFIGEYTGKDIDQRIFGTAATIAFSILNGANILRVHDYSEMMDVVKIIKILNESKMKNA